MRKSKINYEASIKQFDVLLPDSMREAYKNAMSICKDSTDGEKNACEAAFKMITCFANNNPKFTFV